MQIVIPMSGFGERFKQAGYTIPKPLIPIDGKPMIAHVIELFPGETNFIFVCNSEHLEHPDYHMRACLEKYAPTGRIIAIEPHKLGPVHAVMQAESLIDDSQPVIINYCDFSCYWQYQDFIKFVNSTGCDGAIPAYRGFHPHSLGSTYYAYMKTHNHWVSAIQEKKPYTDDPLSEYASSGTYYFATGSLMKEACKQTISQNLNVAGEYYVSLAYQPLLAQQKKIAVYPIAHFMQWGTPQDLHEYQYWSEIFATLARPFTAPKQKGAVCIPMAGLGQRFSSAQFKTPKPLLPVLGKPMVLRALADLPQAPINRLILRENARSIEEQLPEVQCHVLQDVTEGQAVTTLLGIEEIDDEAPITVGACDNGARYNPKAFEAAMADSNIDVLVWGITKHPPAQKHPQMYGWIEADGKGQVQSVSVKVPLDNPDSDPIITGTFTFKRAGDLKKAIARLIARGARVNGEFYLDSAINDAIAMGLQCQLFNLDAYYGWGTPAEWQTFNYWQRCFTLWHSHPYHYRESLFETID